MCVLSCGSKIGTFRCEEPVTARTPKRRRFCEEDVTEKMDVVDETPPAAAQQMPIRDSSLSEILKLGFASQDTKLAANSPSLTLTSVLVRAFVEEARHRATAVALEDGADTVTDEHLEKVLPSVLLDFGP